ncbi:ribonuclease III [bacterium]|nr:ribonuclease III [bacterium]
MGIGKLLIPLFRIKKTEPALYGAKKSLDDFQKSIGYQFQDSNLLEQALKHRSIIPETGETRNEANERLEFLGDAVLDLVVSEILYKQFPEVNEGYLARLKSLVVSGRQLASKARKINLGLYLQMSESEERSGGRNRRSILEDALEAVIGAVYLDGGLKPACDFIATFIANDVSEHLIREKEHNYKSLLLEYAQGNSLGAPRYRVVSEEGPDHAKTFHIEVLVRDKSVGSGFGQSKKQAEQQAAKFAAAFYGISVTD